MRETILRYKWKGKFYYIDLYRDNTAIKFSEYESRNKTTPFEWYTGLKDKKNVKIFEGDRVFDGDKEVVVCFEDGSFGYMSDSPKMFLSFCHCYTNYKELEVIGNIHDK